MTHAKESKSDKTRLSNDVPTLEAEAAALTLERDKTKLAVRQLMEAEDPKNGIYHHEEIFRLQQDKLRLDVEIKFRTNKINRINLGIAELDTADGIKNGFLF
ncbi:MULTISPECIES: hypothetical protein [unclassified Pseudodesulfovibrio]|uniref:hypothetical protein n=1 Tax=unclassified Pseudodesulfovibrio TaxID=2661612 RepID=UPI000FEBE1C0|nr:MULTISPECIES: hypothetical protein [unclassified Pseudodesulfovibrio]MCJ2165508.1 hypothetical protein [Pseudodesulfovibrio sp. S3-i]RWU03127.1 hypothetical protein DWB63_13060 [Pseudodesulfovibrio sp. S3]